MNNDLTAANAARLEKCLKERLKIDGEIVTFAEAIKEMKFEKAGSYEVPRIEFDRRKYNRMDNYKDQAEYERKCAEKKTVYALYLPNSTSHFIVPKMVHDYFICFSLEVAILQIQNINI